ncbi:N-acetyltransferase [Streptomyces sp. MUM 203J]|uniref:N-acetyltransferase n=1 Tax=Streptomyces sp. MUM 203J TaxID=2791990 RepID=UPI0023D96ABC|nr:N-acetyltransferase [Streptomyces sp. MUM 203J]MCH0538329.1 N-acetyltransferase [Streptomyces sp. MUM 203J]
MSLTVTSLAERPGLEEAMWQMAGLWPQFMLQDPVSAVTYEWMARELPEFVLVATDDADGRLVARAFSVPFLLHSERRGGRLPARGWDEVMLWAFADKRDGREPDTVSAVEIAVLPELRGAGLSGRMVAALRDNAGKLGFAEVVAPVRPNAKHLEPRTPMEEYAFRTRPEDGLPHDPWLRVHVRAGGVVDSVAPVSMTIAGSLEEWRSWTGLPFDEDGPVEVPGALAPVRCDVPGGHAVYVEPNVWVRHRL